MTNLLSEVHAIQNPALGAILLWRFVCGFVPLDTEARPAPLQELFLVLPVVFHAETCALVTTTQRASGFRGFVSKFTSGTTARRDLLLLIHARALALRPLSLDSLRIGLASGLLSLHVETASVRPLSRTTPHQIPQRVAPLLKAAEKLGAWCAEVTPVEFAEQLRMEW